MLEPSLPPNPGYSVWRQKLPLNPGISDSTFYDLNTCDAKEEESVQGKFRGSLDVLVSFPLA